MNKTNYFFLSLSVFISLSILCGCQYTGEEKYVSLDDVKYITDFPYNDDLKEIPIDFDEIGLRDLKIVGDSLLVLNHGNSWSLHSADSKKKYGHFLSVGQGPEEFIYIPYISSALFETVQDSLWLYIPDQYNKRIMEYNITEFMNSGDQIIRPVYQNDSLVVPKWAVIPFNKSEFMILDPVDDYHRFMRKTVSGNTFTEIPITKPLSLNSIKGDANELNLISAVIRYIPEVDKFIETMIYMNQINIYSLDGQSGTTICVGDKLDNLAKIEDSTRYNRLWTYQNGFGNKLGFGAIYFGHTQNPIEKKDSEIQFFNWDNTPVYRVRIPYESISADLDVTHKRLWVIDKGEDELRCYDATPIINAYLNK